MATEESVVLMPAQVTVCHARFESWNGVYHKKATINHRCVYEHCSGAFIFYDPTYASWNLSGGEGFDGANADYSLSSVSILPPEGEWPSRRGHKGCRVKAPALSLFL